jgi:hypothetical protein
MESMRSLWSVVCVVVLVTGCVRDEEALSEDGGTATQPPAGAGLSISAPADVQQEASGIMTAVALGNATTSGGEGTVTVSHDAPASFPLGMTMVTWTATDTASNQATATQQIALTDTTPPSLSAPGNVVGSQAGALTTVNLGAPTVSDLVDANPVITNDAPQGGFPVGTTTVSWTATDASNNSNTGTQLVTINAMPPGSNLSIVAPGNVQQEATGPATMVNLGQPTVTGGNGNVTVTNNAPGGGFSLGATTVTWTATDANNVSAMAAQLITITDTTAPMITAPADVMADQNGDPTMVNLGQPTVSDLVDPNPTISSNAPAQGFPLGTTVVTWTTTDTSGNSATASQAVTVNMVAAACSSHEAEFANTVYPILDSPARCQNCHTPPNTVSTLNNFNLLANDTAAFDLFQVISAIPSNGQSVMLVKPLGGAGHGGGNRFQVNGANDPDYLAIESLVNKLAVCTPDAPPQAQGVQLGTNYEQLYTVSVALGGRVPTATEVSMVESASDQTALDAALDAIVDGLLNEDTFLDRVREIYNDLLLTDADANDRGGPDNNFDLREFANEEYFDNYNGDRKQDANYGLARAPLELIEYVINNNRPFNEIMTADYFMVNPYSATIYGVDAGDANFPFSSDNNPANHDRDDFRPVATLTQDDGTVVPGAGILGTHAFLARYPSTNTNVNRARARYAFDYFLGMDIEGLAARDGLDLDNVIGDVPTMQDPQCTVCHDVMDPVAGLFKNRANDGRYQGDVTWHNERFTNGVQRMLDPGYTINPSDELPASDTATALQWFASLVAQDDRFAQRTVRTVFEGLTGIQTTAPATTTFLTGVKDNFITSGFDFKAMVKEIALSPYLLGRNLAAGEDPASFADVGSAQLLTPEQLERKISSVTGGAYSWRGPNTNSGLLGRHLLLYGGIDSRNVTQRTSDPNSLIDGVQRRIANQASCDRVAADLRTGGTLFPIASISDVPTDSAGATRIQENIQFLHRHLLGEDLAVDHPEVLTSYQLFQDVRGLGESQIPGDCRGGGASTDDNGTILPWMAVVTYLLSTHEFLYQ